MPTLSLCMIVKNEEDVLARCLKSVRPAVDEIIIVDTGSTDKTREIARSFTDRVYDFDWCDDFSRARNFSFSKAGQDYIMWLDADDVFDEYNLSKLIELKENLSADVVMMKYHVAFDRNGSPTLSYYRERIFKRSCGFVWQGAVHEAITPRGDIIYSDAAVFHKKIKASDPDRNLNIFKKLLSGGTALDTRQKFYYARELYFHGDYKAAIDAFNDFFAQTDRWRENSISACLDLSRCYSACGSTQQALLSLFNSFIYDSPRAEICCEIGKIKLNSNSFDEAAFWFETALRCTPQTQKGGFSSPDCFGYIPCIQLAVCYDRLGDPEKANYYNELAGSYRPGDPSYLFNKSYFEKILNPKN